MKTFLRVTPVRIIISKYSFLLKHIDQIDRVFFFFYLSTAESVRKN